MDQEVIKAAFAPSRARDGSLVEALVSHELGSEDSEVDRQISIFKFLLAKKVLTHKALRSIIEERIEKVSMKIQQSINNIDSMLAPELVEPQTLTELFA